ncbi:hypothetical protein [Chitinibacter sp. GC72]|uniref:hypothetical protein n=1 Tax=Chitinibacter sp. GC72 TaxID=1526917 RepID=UPI0012FB1924|nr:hypothetical protein [Chitinibacter sp. GC72]
MKVSGQPYRCALAKLQPNPMDVEQVKRQGWQQEQILVVNADDTRLDWTEKELVRRLGERLYGQGGQRG